MWTRVTLMVKEGQNDVTMTTTITIVVDISAMAQWYTGYKGLYTGFCRTVKTGLKSKRSIVLDAEQILVSYYYPFRNQWRRFLFRINEKLYKTKSNKNNYYHHTAFTACKQLEIVFLQTIPIINQVYFCSICFLLGGR